MLSLDFNHIPSRFINNEAVVSMTHFGKGVFDPAKLKEIKINTQARPESLVELLQERGYEVEQL